MDAPTWWPDVLRRVERGLATHPFWRGIRLVQHPGVHLGVFVEPYLEHILAGRKTVESRFGRTRCAPHGQVAQGDVLILKRSSGPVVGVCMINDIWSFDLTRQSIDGVRKRFARALCAEEEAFWDARRDTKIATLMQISHVAATSPQTTNKRDRRGWVTIRRQESLLEHTCNG